jgi:DNA modification methylase
MIQQIQGFPCACGCGQVVVPHEGKGRPEQYYSPACRVRAHRQRKSSVTKIEMDVTKISNTIIQGDVLAILHKIPDACVQCCITSPPYWNLRDYGTPGQIGLEETPQAYIEKLVSVFREVRRILRDDGTLWLNLGDTYANDDKWGGSTGGKHVKALHQEHATRHRRATGLAPKNLMGIPWRVAMALQDDEWILRSDVIWHKPTAMPEPVQDRPTKAHEYLFLLTKSERYYYDAQAVMEPAVSAHPSGNGFKRAARLSFQNADGTARGNDEPWQVTSSRNRRSVWSINTVPYPGAHFAVMPPKLVEPCILAGSASQACKQCGAPWRPIIIKGPKAPEPEDRHPNKRLEPGQAGNVSDGNIGFRASRLSGQEMAVWRALHPDRCEGYQPSCTCPEMTGAGRCLVLDPFAGSGTVLAVAKQFGRDYLGIELNPEYISLAHDRLDSVQPSLWQPAE